MSIVIFCAKHLNVMYSVLCQIFSTCSSNLSPSHKLYDWKRDKYLCMWNYFLITKKKNNVSFFCTLLNLYIILFHIVSTLCNIRKTRSDLECVRK